MRISDWSSDVCSSDLIVVPSISILAEPSVALVDANATKHGTTAVAEAYLKFLYTPEAQELIAKNYYRPRNADVAAKYAGTFPKLDLVTIKDFGGWQQAQTTYFADGGVRSEERRVGKGCVSTCRSRWLRYL